MRVKLRRVRNFIVNLLKKVSHLSSTNYISLSSKVHTSIDMGKYCYIGPGGEIPQGVKFGNYVMVAKDLLISGNDHNFDNVGTPVIFSGRPPHPTTVIEDDVWIGARVIIKTGVKIGRGSVVAAGAIVVKNVDPYNIVAGIPANKIKERFDSESDKLAHDEMLARDAYEGAYCKKID